MNMYQEGKALGTMPEAMKIYTYPDRELRIKAEPVESINGELQDLIDRMAETMYAAPGIGLAAVQVGVGNVLEPKIMGQSLDMHPVTVLLSLMFWGMIWGVAGMFLAVPMTAVIKIVLEHIELTAPVAALLAGQPIEKAVDLPERE